MDTVAGYRLAERPGEGGTDEVGRAHPVALDRPVALARQAPAGRLLCRVSAFSDRARIAAR